MEPTNEFNKALFEMIKKAMEMNGIDVYTAEPQVTMHVNCNCNLCDAVEQANKFKAGMNQLQNMPGTLSSEIEALSQALLNLAKPTLEDQLQDALVKAEYELSWKKLNGLNVRMN